LRIAKFKRLSLLVGAIAGKSLNRRYTPIRLPQSEIRNLLELLWANVHTDAQNVVDGQTCSLGVLAARINVGCFKLAERTLAVGGYVTTKPLHSHLIASGNNVLANSIKFLRSKWRKRTCDQESRHRSAKGKEVRAKG